MLNIFTFCLKKVCFSGCKDNYDYPQNYTTHRQYGKVAVASFKKNFKVISRSLEIGLKIALHV